MQSARFICPVVGLEMNGRHRSVFKFLASDLGSQCCAELNGEQLKMLESVTLQIVSLPRWGVFVLLPGGGRLGEH